jgi:hypothetical protein
MTRWLNNLSGVLSFGSRGRKTQRRRGPHDAKLRVRGLAIEPLETRVLLDASLPAGSQATSTLDLHFFNGSVNCGSMTPWGWGLTPNQIRGAYGLGSYTSGVLSNGITFGAVPGDGRGQTIAIVDAYDDPTALSDLNAFSTYFGLPTFGGSGNPTFQKLNQNGGTTLPGTDPSGPWQTTGAGDWEIEESLDIEWAHVMAPMANIILFEANDEGNNGANLFTAVQTAASTAGVVAVSMSWAYPENLFCASQEWSYDSTCFTTPSGHYGGSATLGGAELAGGVTFLAASGDGGGFAGCTDYPAASPNVVAVGGTTLTVDGSDPDYTYGGETVWGCGLGSWAFGGSGGGISLNESQPAYQNGVVSAFSTTQRTYPDVSADADPSSGVPIYDSYDFGASGPWIPGVVGGTSLACPLWAGIIAVADEGRAIAGQGSLDGPSQTLPQLYNLPAADFHDITSGNTGYPAGPGYDLAIGIGTPVANLLIPAFIGQAATTLTVSASSSSVTYGQSVTFTATVSAQTGSAAPTAGSVDFYDSTAGYDLGLGTLDSSTGAASTWTLATGAKTFNATTGDTITATYTSGWFSAGSSGATVETVTPFPITVTAAASTKVYDGTTDSAAVPTITPGNVVSGDTAVFAESFDTSNSGSGLTLMPTGAVVDGNAGENYAVTFVANTTGQITPLPITVTAATSTKGYDGMTSSTAAPTITGGSLVSVYVGIVTTLAGSAGQIGSNDGTGSAASFESPSGAAVDSAGNVYVADAGNDTIRKITPSGVVTTLAGSPGQAGCSDGTGSAASFDCPEGVAVDSAGNVYVADSWNFTIRKITPSGVVTTLAGSPGQAGCSDGTGSDASFWGPQGVAVDSAGNVYVADTSNDEIRKITPLGVVTTLAGFPGQYEYGSSDGTGSAARFCGPTGVAVDSAGNVYVADAGNDEIRKITPSGVVTTLAGYAGEVGAADGSGSAASFDYPEAVAVDSAGNVYVADTLNDEIREISPSGVVNTLAGSTGQPGSSDGTGGEASFWCPLGVAVDSAGNVYVADTVNQEIRLVSLVGRDTPAFTESYGSRNEGTGLTLTPTGSVNDGNGGHNYAVTFVANTTGVITARAITVTAATNTKTYDGTTSAAATPAVTAGSLVSGDAAAFTESYGSPDVGTRLTLTAAGSVNDGYGGQNYAVTYVANTTGQITAGPAAQLAFVTQPSNTPGAGTIPDVQVAVEDAYGNLVTGDNSSVTLSLNQPAAGDGGGGVLNGTTTVNAVDGVATFSGLSIVDPSNSSYSDAGTGYSLTANDTDTDGAPDGRHVRRLQHDHDRQQREHDLHGVRGHVQPTLQSLRAQPLRQLRVQRAGQREPLGRRGGAGTRLPGDQLDRHPGHFRGDDLGQQHRAGGSGRFVRQRHVGPPRAGRLHRDAGQPGERHRDLFRNGQRATAGRRR